MPSTTCVPYTENYIIKLLKHIVGIYGVNINIDKHEFECI